MAIHQWPRARRPREKLLSLGVDVLSDAELLAILLRTGVRGSSALQLAHLLLYQFGGLNEILSADASSFREIPGIGNARYATLQTVRELARRSVRESPPTRDVIGDPQSAREHLQAVLGDSPNEVFACLWLDTRHRVLRLDELFHGTIDGAAVYPREVVRHAIRRNAAAVILAHNHPSGIAEPSRQDREITKRLQAALALVDVRIIDHIVIGAGESTSFAERGWL